MNKKKIVAAKTATIASLGIMGSQFRALLKPLKHHSTMVSRGLRRALNWAPIIGRREDIGQQRKFFTI